MPPLVTYDSLHHWLAPLLVMHGDRVWSAQRLLVLLCQAAILFIYGGNDDAIPMPTAAAFNALDIELKGTQQPYPPPFPPLRYQGIRIVKYYAWEVPFVERIAALRDMEVDKVKSPPPLSRRRLAATYRSNCKNGLLFCCRIDYFSRRAGL